MNAFVYTQEGQGAPRDVQDLLMSFMEYVNQNGGDPDKQPRSREALRELIEALLHGKSWKLTSYCGDASDCHCFGCKQNLYNGFSLYEVRTFICGNLAFC